MIHIAWAYINYSVFKIQIELGVPYFYWQILTNYDGSSFKMLLCLSKMSPSCFEYVLPFWLNKVFQNHLILFLL